MIYWARARTSYQCVVTAYNNYTPSCIESKPQTLRQIVTRIGGRTLAAEQTVAEQTAAEQTAAGGRQQASD